MKKIFTLVLFSFSLLLEGCSGSIYTPGSYEGEGEGRGGTITVSVRVNEKEIESIEVVDSSESEFSFEAMNMLIKRAVEANSSEVDSVAGASETSSGMIEAIGSALGKAKAPL